MSDEAVLIMGVFLVIILVAAIYLANAAWNAETWFDLVKPLVVAIILGMTSFGGSKK